MCNSIGDIEDSIRLAERATESGVKVELEIWDGMWQVFQGFAMIAPEAKKAIINIGEFIKKHLNQRDKQHNLSAARDGA